MNMHGLADMLAEAYAGAPPRRIARTIVLFGLRNAEALQGVPFPDHTFIEHSRASCNCHL